MGRILFLIGTGGFIAGILRYITTIYFTKLFPSAFPYGTFLVNILGCLLIGIVYGLSERLSWFTPEWRLFIATGLCGGFTTFSAFAYENVKLLQEGNYGYFVLYSTLTFVFGLLAVIGGSAITKITT